MDYCPTGTLRWTYSLPPDAKGGYAFHVVDATIYAYFRHDMLAINAHDGRVLWLWSAPPALQVAHLQPAHNTLYLEMRETDPVSAQFHYATISALDAQTGKQIWEYVPPVSTPIVKYLGADDATGIAFALQGSTDFFQGKGDLHSGKLLALQAATGAILWQDDGAPLIQQFVSAAGVAYYWDGTGTSASVSARRINTGQVLWQTPGFTENGQIADLAAQTIIVTDNTGMTVLGVADGKSIVHINIPLYSAQGPIYQPSLIANDTIYVMPFDQQTLTAYAVADGGTRWSSTLGPAFTSGSAMYRTLRANAANITVSTTQDITAFAVHDGHRLWLLHHAGQMVINTACASYFIIDYTDDGAHWQRALIRSADGMVVWQQQGDQHYLSGLGGDEMTQLSNCP